jgi:glycosyltransferase involved in cell wall biosynthesis
MKQKRVIIHWTKRDSRSASLAYHLDADALFVQSLRGHTKLLAPAKYLLNALVTLQWLYRKNPDIIFVVNPPIFAVLVVWAYSISHRRSFVVDTHSAAFTARRWSLFLWVYRLLSTRALLHILHNEVLENEVARWGVPTVNFGELLYQIKGAGSSFPFRNGFNVVFVSLFAEDEPLEEVVEAAQRAPEINFYITGSLVKAPKKLMRKAPYNVIFTDFLSDESYGSLLRGSDIVISLTKNDNTMQNAAYESLVIGRPVITSNWPVLRDLFRKGAICVDNSSESIVSAIRRIKTEYPRYLKEILELQAEFKTTWQKKFSTLLKLLDGQPSTNDEVIGLGPSSSRVH